MIEKHFVQQGMKKLELDAYLLKELDRAGFTKSEIVKTPLVTRIVVNVTRPGLAIGKSGSNISLLTQAIGEKFGIDNPQLEIKEIEHPELDAQAVANKMKALIERGFSWRSIIFKSINEIQHSGAQGVEIVLSGKIAGKAGRKRKQRFASGYMKKVGEQAKLVDYGKAAAYPRVGAIGIKVKIVKPDTVFPDKEKIAEYIKAREAKKEAVENAEAKEKAEKEEKAKEETEEVKEKPAEKSAAEKAVEKVSEKKEKKPEKLKEKPKEAEEKKEVPKEHKKEVKEKVAEEKPKKEEVKKEETKPSEAKKESAEVKEKKSEEEKPETPAKEGAE